MSSSHEPCTTTVLQGEQPDNLSGLENAAGRVWSKMYAGHRVRSLATGLFLFLTNGPKRGREPVTSTEEFEQV